MPWIVHGISMTSTECSTTQMYIHGLDIIFPAVEVFSAECVHFIYDPGFIESSLHQITLRCFMDFGLNIKSQVAVVVTS